MRKLLLGVAMLLFAQMGFGQAVQESAIIPVSVTLNAVSRLSIESGGNIKFVFTSIDDYNTGFTGVSNPLYRTTVAISSSRDYTVTMYSETADFVPTDNVANILPIGNLGYNLTWTGDVANTPTAYHDTYQQMTNVTTTEIISAGGVAGRGTDNRFDINWRIGTTEGLGTFLSQGNIPADHYTANIIIELKN